MGENTRRRTTAPEQEAQPWLAMMVKFGSAVAPWALIVGGVALVIVLGLITLNKIEFGWLPNVLAAVSFFLLLGFTALFFKCYASLAPGWTALVLGAALHLGGPFLIGILAKVGSLTATAGFVDTASKSLKDVGFFLIVLAVLRLLMGFYTYATSQHHVAKKQFQYLDLSKEDAAKISFIPKCWQMSRCRPAVRMSCPNYIDRRTCWGRRSGCFCDRDLANYLLQSVDTGETTEVTEVSQAAVSRSAPPARGAKRPWKLQKSLCYNCPLFIEHQEYKFKHLRWISFPITLAIGAALYFPYHEGFVWFAAWLEGATQKLIALGNLPENFNPSATSLGSGFEIFLGVILLLLACSWVMEFTERMFLKWNL